MTEPVKTTLRRELAMRFDAFDGVDAYGPEAERRELVDTAVYAVLAWLDHYPQGSSLTPEALAMVLELQSEATK